MPEKPQTLMQDIEAPYRHTAFFSATLQWTANARGMLDSCTEGITALTGLPREQVLGNGWRNAIHPEDIPRTTQMCRRALATGEAYDVEHRVRATDGGWRWLRTRAFPEHDADGRIARWIGYTEDIDRSKRAELALREAEEDMRLALTASRAGTWHWNVATGGMRVGGHYRDIYGFGPDDLIDHAAWISRLHPDDRARMMARVSALTSTAAETCSEEFRVVHPMRGVRWVTAVGTAARDADGRALSMRGINIDVTERRLHQARMRESEKRFEALADSCPLMIWMTDPQANVVFVNKAYRRFFFGESEPSARGSAWLQLLHPEDRDGYADQYEAVLRERRPFHAVARVRRWDGEWRWVESFAQPQFSANGELLAYVGSSPDITERKQAEDALRHAEQQFRTSQDASMHGYAILCAVRDASDDIVDLEWEYVNPAATRLWKRRAGDLVGHKLLEVLPGHRTACDLFDRYVQVIRAGEPTEFELFYDADSVRGWFHFSVVKVGDGIAASFMNISERKRLEEEVNEKTARLQESDRRKSEFLAMLSHELRNPLAPISNCIHYLNRIGLDPAAQGPLQVIARQVEHIVRLVDDLLDLSRIDRGKMQLRRQVVSLAAIIERAAETARAAIEARQQFLTVEKPERPLYLNADPVRITQVISNLLSNASKFSPGRGEIRLVAWRENDLAAVAVSDKGTGIPADQLDDVFDMFVQLDNTQDAKTMGGLGLGLTLARNLVEMHGGSISVASPGENRGATFTVRLPLASGAPRTREAETPARQPRRALRVLVVDDNIDAAETLAAALRLAGHEVHTAHEGMAALEAADRFAPQAVLLDIGLPDIVGHEVARLMRERHWGRTALLVALTGWGQDEDVRRSLESGMDYHLTKPVDIDDLLHLLDGPSGD